jgi:hypothetical protein
MDSLEDIIDFRCKLRSVVHSVLHVLVLLYTIQLSGAPKLTVPFWQGNLSYSKMLLTGLLKPKRWEHL